MDPRPRKRARKTIINPLDEHHDVDQVHLQIVDPDGTWHHYDFRNDISIGRMKEALSRDTSWWDQLPTSRKCLYLIEGTRPYREVSNECSMHRFCVLGNRPELMQD